LDRVSGKLWAFPPVRRDLAAIQIGAESDRGQLRRRGAQNGGFSRVSGADFGRVGTVALERSA
jgi:hypothetical protein